MLFARDRIQSDWLNDRALCGHAKYFAVSCVDTFHSLFAIIPSR
jgi:hypothetical protein